MSIGNLNNGKDFLQFSLQAKMNSTKATNNSANIVDAKIETSKSSTINAKSITTATLKSNQGTKFDSEALLNGKIGDVVPQNDQPTVAKAKGKDKDKDGDKKSLGDCIADGQKKAEELYGQSVTSSTDPNQGNATQVVLVGVVWGIIDYFRQ